jgi:ABC-2 type transport system permease protein
VSARGTLRFAGALLATNLKATFALRGAFWLQAAFMAANNAVFFSVWWIFFRRFDDIGGWKLRDMLALYGIAATSFGLAVVVGSGMRDLARTISDGDLDPYLVQPKDLLLHVVGSRCSASGFGDLVSGAVLLGLSGHVTWATAPGVVVCTVAGATVFLSCGVLFHSLAFWLGPVNDWARQTWEFLIVFTVYPQTIYGPFLRVLLFTVLPAGFIGFVPVEWLRAPSPTGLAIAVGAAALYAALAYAVFRRGLKRYESGNRFGVRA